MWSNPRSKWNEDFGSDAQLFFYLADEGGNVLDVGKENLNIRESSLLASGSRTDIGDWQLHLKSTVMLWNGIMSFCLALVDKSTINLMKSAQG